MSAKLRLVRLISLNNVGPMRAGGGIGAGDGAREQTWDLPGMHGYFLFSIYIFVRHIREILKCGFQTVSDKVTMED